MWAPQRNFTAASSGISANAPRSTTTAQAPVKSARITVPDVAPPMGWRKFTTKSAAPAARRIPHPSRSRALSHDPEGPDG